MQLELVIAIVLTLLATTIMNLGLVLQKKGVTELAALPPELRRGRVRKYFRCPTWRWGMVLLVIGYIMFMAASFYRVAPISLLQPIFASGVLVLAFMAVVYLKERFGPLEWVGVFLLLVAVILLGASAEPIPKSEAQIDVARLLIFLGAAAVLVAVGIAMLNVLHGHVNSEILYGVLAGVLLGIGYLNTRTFGLGWRLDMKPGHLSPGHPWLALLGFAALIVGLIGGLVVLQKGFHRGRALIVTTLNMVVNQVAVIGGGLFCMKEHFPSRPDHFYERIIGLAGILVGIVMLARFSSEETIGPQDALGEPEDARAPGNRGSRFISLGVQGEPN